MCEPFRKSFYRVILSSAIKFDKPTQASLSSMIIVHRNGVKVELSCMPVFCETWYKGNKIYEVRFDSID